MNCFHLTYSLPSIFSFYKTIKEKIYINILYKLFFIEAPYRKNNNRHSRPTSVSHKTIVSFIFVWTQPTPGTIQGGHHRPVSDKWPPQIYSIENLQTGSLHDKTESHDPTT